MASWPTIGGSAGTWGTELINGLLVGHNTDGTHNQEDWTPSTYAAEQSVTLPNGLIVKFGQAAFSSGSATVTFGTAFPTGIISVIATPYQADVQVWADYFSVTSASASAIKLSTRNSSFTGAYWFAIGY